MPVPVAQPEAQPDAQPATNSSSSGSSSSSISAETFVPAEPGEDVMDDDVDMHARGIGRASEDLDDGEAEKRQRVEAVEDWFDRDLSPEERHEARVDELKKLLSFGGLIARRKAEARGYNVLPHTLG